VFEQVAPGRLPGERPGDQLGVRRRAVQEHDTGAKLGGQVARGGLGDDPRAQDDHRRAPGQVAHLGQASRDVDASRGD
jgi:hypothetical protein